MSAETLTNRVVRLEEWRRHDEPVIERTSERVRLLELRVVALACIGSMVGGGAVDVIARLTGGNG